MSTALVENFYTSFQQLDANGMAACYHKEVSFEDPAFGVLKGMRAANMWRMLCENQKGKDFKLTFSDIRQAGDSVKARWEARYTFSRTGRRVHNIIEASFRFKDGKIIDHLDEFDLYRWSKQALGLPGYLMGWTGFFRKKLNGQTARMLAVYESRMRNDSIN